MSSAEQATDIPEQRPARDSLKHGEHGEHGEKDPPPTAAPVETDDEQPSAVLAPIVVEGETGSGRILVERSFETPDDVAGFGETIFADPIWRGFETTAELIGQGAGAQLRRRGGRDDFSTLSIRGAPSGQLKILLDGVSLGRASDSIVNLADLPLDTVERIEIYRGFAPVSLTAASAAGVVNVITRDPKHTTTSAAIGGGSFGSAKVNASGAGPVGGGDASAFASFRRTEGDFEYVENNGTVNNPADDFVTTRLNNDSETVESLLRWRRPVGPATKLQLRNHVFFKDEGVPAARRRVAGDVVIARPAASKARLQTIREIAALAIGGDDRRWSIEQNVTWEQEKLTDFAQFDNTGETTAATTSARWGRPLGKAHWFAGSAEYTWEGFEQQAGGSALSHDEATRSSLAVAAGDDWTIEAFRTTASFQLRHQQLWNDDSSVTGGIGSSSDHSTDPRVGVRWDPGLGLTVKANASSYFRPPTFDELYGTTGFTTGNPALVPETGIAWDVGFEWVGERDPFGRLALGYAWFGSNIDDVIVVLQTPDRSAKARNESGARIRGHEARVEWQGPFGVAVSGNYTFQDAENRSKLVGFRGKELPGLPPHEAWARISWSHRRFVVAYDIDVSGTHYNDTANDEPKIPTRTVHGLEIVFGPFARGFRLTFEANNLGNSLVPDEIGFPLPGRSFFGTLSWSPAADDEVARAR